jgi:tetratricopeptide (TPR) repeat protein
MAFIARQHSDSGRLGEAEGLCRRILRERPGDFDALHLLGSVISRDGRPQQAIPFLTQASLQRADAFAVQLDLARACAAAGDRTRAIEVYRQCIHLAPHLAHPHVELGVLLSVQQMLREAIEMLQRAIEIDPHDAVTHFHLGVALAHCGELQRAIAAYRGSIELDSNRPEPLANLGVLLRGAGDLAGALDAYYRALALLPESAEIHCNLGVALAQQDRTDEAIVHYERAIALDPGFANAHFNLANAMRKRDDHPCAIEIFRRAIELQPDLVQAWSNMGMSFGDLGEHAQALAAYDRAVELRPEWAEARWNRSLTYLLKGDFVRGWAEFDCRNQIEPPSSRTFPGQRWNGEDIRGKTIVLNYEMGLGDSIHFLRYVPLVAQRAGRVILEIQEPLRELCESVVGVDRVVSIQRGDPFDEYDCHCSLMRLPQLYRSDLATMPASVPYLRPSEARRRKWLDRLGPRDSALRIGLVWAGSPLHQNDRQRSIPLSHLASLAAGPDIQFVSLQRGPASAQAAHPPTGMRLTDVSTDLENLADTAAVIELLDLVISVDTSVAHLAGALGKPIWILLAYVPDWRWLLEREDTPWYPTMRLFRQRKLGDWSDPIARLTRALREQMGRP